MPKKTLVPRRNRRICRICHFMQPLSLFGVGREEYKCAYCVHAQIRGWYSYADRLSAIYNTGEVDRFGLRGAETIVDIPRDIEGERQYRRDRQNQIRNKA